MFYLLPLILSLSLSLQLMLDIDQVSITLLQEHPKTGEVSSAFSILLGSYGNKGLHIQAQEWSGEVSNHTL